MRQPEEILMEFLAPIKEHKLFTGDRQQFAFKSIAFVSFIIILYLVIISNNWGDLIKILLGGVISFLFIIFLFHILDLMDELVEQDSVLGILKILTIILLIAILSVVLG